MDANDLATETCIPIGLVKGILLRLQDKELIDEYNFVIKQDIAIEGDSSPIFASAPLFRELATGKDFAIPPLLSEANPLLKREGREKRLSTVRPSDLQIDGTPTERDVIQALRSTKSVWRLLVLRFDRQQLNR